MHEIRYCFYRPCDWTWGLRDTLLFPRRDGPSSLQTIPLVSWVWDSAPGKSARLPGAICVQESPSPCRMSSREPRTLLPGSQHGFPRYLRAGKAPLPAEWTPASPGLNSRAVSAAYHTIASRESPSPCRMSSREPRTRPGQSARLPTLFASIGNPSPTVHVP